MLHPFIAINLKIFLDDNTKYITYLSKTKRFSVSCYYIYLFVNRLLLRWN